MERPPHTAPVLIEVERFEYLGASSERVLLRLDGQYVERPGRRILDATLFVDDGLAVHRHGPLPEREAPTGANESWLWRAAFSVPASYLTDARTRFALEAEPDRLVELPAPRRSRLAQPERSRGTRAGHTARRYALALAVIVTVAVSPGGLPASARTQIIKVRRPDGTIVFLAPDGSELPAPPPGADVVDGPAPAPSPSAPVAQAPATSGQAAGPATTSTGQPHGTAPPRVQRQASPRSDANVRSPQDHAVRPHPRHDAPRAAQHAAPRASVPPPAVDAQQPLESTSAAPHAADRRHGAGGAASPPTAEPAPPSSIAGPALQPLPDVIFDQADTQSLLQPIVPQPPAPATHGATLVPPATLGVDEQGQAARDPAKAPPLTPLSGRLPAAPPLASTGGSIKAHRAPPPPPRPAPKPHPEPQPAPPAPRVNPARPAPAPAAPAPAPTSSPGIAATTPFDALPGPATPTSVPMFLLDRFQIPPFLLSIYQAAAVEYGIRWEVLAAINEIETDYGRDLSVSSAGAVGWMQFMPATWKMYGVDANQDGKRDPYNPVDAIFAAARYLKAAGGDKDIRQGIYAYNHASWYVDSVMLRAKLIASYPPDLIAALTGLTEGRFPVAAPARYAGAALQSKQPSKPAPLPAPTDPTAGVDIYSHAGAPVVAVGDGVVKKIGRSRVKGLYVVLEDVYGNQYTYSGLGQVASVYPVPKIDIAANDATPAAGANDPVPHSSATAGTQQPGGGSPGGASAPIVGVKQRLFAHPMRPSSQDSGGLEQVLAANDGSGFETYDAYFARPLGLNSRNATLRPLRPGSTVIASTVLGRVGAAARPAQSRIHFEIRPAGKGAPEIDPRPILDGWRLLETSDVYGPSGRNPLSRGMSIGEMMLLPKPALEQRVLADKRIKIYAGGRQDIGTGQIDRRVLEVLEYLADAGLDPTVSCLKSGHSELTTSGNVSEHASGNAVDIAAINGTPILGHQSSGGIAEQTVRRLMQLQGTLQPHQIISLLSFGQNTLSMPDHADHIHVGFQPLLGDNSKLGAEAASVLQPDQWSALAKRLGQLDNPVVSLTPSKYALPDH